MRPQVLALPLLLLSCSVGHSKLTLTVDSTRLVADGETGTVVKVCNDSDEPADLTVMLRSSTGSWEGAADDDPQSIEVALTADAICAEATWLAPSKVGQVRFEVEVDGVVRAREARKLLKAEVSAVEIKGGLLSEEQVSALTLTADVATKTGGTATDGSVIDLVVVGSVPAGVAYLSDPSIVVGKRDHVLLYAPAGTESIDVQATVDGSPAVTSCRRFSTSTIQPCP